jgi:hypothetical protein
VRQGRLKASSTKLKDLSAAERLQKHHRAAHRRLIRSQLLLPITPLPANSHFKKRKQNSIFLPISASFDKKSNDLFCLKLRLLAWEARVAALLTTNNN